MSKSVLLTIQKTGSLTPGARSVGFSGEVPLLSLAADISASPWS